MAVTVACIVSERIFHPWDAGRIEGRRIAPRPTPFGPSADVFLIDAPGPAFYLAPRYGSTASGPGDRGARPRATLYVLKDLGVQHVLEWAPAGAVTHTVAIGDLVLPTDLIDRTSLRPRTFFEGSPVGAIRQFPVFCPTLRQAAGQVLHEMKLVYHGAGTVAVTEGPRLETPAEIRQLAHAGVELVSHAFVPEVFLAKELQLCYAGLAYVVSYAETGRQQRPFALGNLFGGLTQQTDAERLAAAVGALNEIVRNITDALGRIERTCQCAAALADHVRQYNLSEDWHEWFA